MKSTLTKVILIILAVFIFVSIAAFVGLRWYVNSGKLLALAQAKAAKALNANVTMDSLHLSWPLTLDIENLEVSAPGHEQDPLFVCRKFRVAAKLWNVMRNHVDSLVLIGARVSIVENEDGALNVPKLPPTDKPYTAGTLKLINGDVSVDMSMAKGEIKGILATLSEPSIFRRGARVAKVNFDSADIVIGEQAGTQIPIHLKLFQSNVTFRDKQSTKEVKADMESLVTTELPHLLLPPDIPVGLSCEFDYTPSRDSIENGIFTGRIPVFSNISVYGGVVGITSGAVSPALNFAIDAPEIAKLIEYSEVFQRPNYEDIKMDGTLNINGEIKGNMTSPQLSLRAGVSNGTVEWKDIHAEGLDIDIPVSIEAENYAVGPGRINVATAVIPVAGENIEMTSLGAEVSADNSTAHLNEFRARIGDLDGISLKGTYELSSGHAQGSAHIATAKVSDVLALIPASVFEFPENLSLDGTLDVDCDIDTDIGAAPENISMKYNVSLREGEMSSGEFLAAAGVDADLSGHIEADSLKEPWTFDVSGDMRDFEFLIDTFYKDLSERTFPFQVSGAYNVDTSSIEHATASIGLGPSGKVIASGTAQFSSAPVMEAKIKSDKIDLNALVNELGDELLSGISPFLHNAEIDGVMSVDIAVQTKGGTWKSDGILNLDGGRVALNEGTLGVDSITAHVPFGIYLPQEEGAPAVHFNQEDYGRLTCSNINAGPVNIPSLVLDIAVMENALSVKGPTSIKLFGGTVDIGSIGGENLLGSSARLWTSLDVKNIDIGMVANSMELPAVVGMLNADLSEITLTLDALNTTGTSSMNLFGGTIGIGSLSVEEPLSSIRTIKADLDFRDIDLLRVTRVLEFGSISGVMEGTLQGLEISQGQPAAFVADFETVKRKGIPQKINIAAVENITIIGTGHGFQAGIGRGIATFFDEFGYDRIGFYCSLKNDNFIIKGKVVENDTEYFVRGITLGPQINVINRSPGQTVSFKSMLERISRVQKRDTKEN
jgi:hypothetical protein